MYNTLKKALQMKLITIAVKNMAHRIHLEYGVSIPTSVHWMSPMNAAIAQYHTDENRVSIYVYELIQLKKEHPTMSWHAYIESVLCHEYGHALTPNLAFVQKHTQSMANQCDKVDTQEEYMELWPHIEKNMLWAETKAMEYGSQLSTHHHEFYVFNHDNIERYNIFLAQIKRNGLRHLTPASPITKQIREHDVPEEIRLAAQR